MGKERAYEVVDHQGDPYWVCRWCSHLVDLPGPEASKDGVLRSR